MKVWLFSIICVVLTKDYSIFMQRCLLNPMGRLRCQIYHRRHRRILYDRKGNVSHSCRCKKVIISAPAKDERTGERDVLCSEIWFHPPPVLHLRESPRGFQNLSGRHSGFCGWWGGIFRLYRRDARIYFWYSSGNTGEHAFLQTDLFLRQWMGLYQSDFPAHSVHEPDGSQITGFYGSSLLEIL